MNVVEIPRTVSTKLFIIVLKIYAYSKGHFTERSFSICWHAHWMATMDEAGSLQVSRVATHLGIFHCFLSQACYQGPGSELKIAPICNAGTIDTLPHAMPPNTLFNLNNIILYLQHLSV